MPSTSVGFTFRGKRRAATRSHAPTRPINGDQRQRRWGTCMLAVLMLALIGMVGRLVYVNTQLAPMLLAQAEKNRFGYTTIPARRGRILDSRGRVLAATKYLYDVFIDPVIVPDVEELARQLGPRINRSSAEILDKITARPGSRYVVVAEEVDRVTADAVRELNAAGVGLADRPRREYPLGRTVAHVVGFVGREHRGLEGLELAFDKELAGKDGRVNSIRDARRRALWRTSEGGRMPVDGNDVQLTIDAEIQRIAMEALQAQIEQFSAESGVAVVLDAKSGDVLAMGCAPTFDPENPGAVPADVRRNRAVTDPVEPGSTFKPFIAAGALDHGFVSLTEKIDCHMGTHYFGSRRVTDTKPHGLMDLTGIITRSSNIGMALIGERMGNPVLHQTIRGFGFGEPTGVECPGESAGVVHPLHRWTSYSTASVSFGYEVLVTPIQLATAFTAILNDGVQQSPRLLDRIVAPDGHIVRWNEPAQAPRQILSVVTADYLAKTALVSVVESGGAARHVAGPYTVLGKSGTAKLLAADGKTYASGSYLATFMAAAPVSDPQLAAVVMVRRPDASRGYYGAMVSAPAVGRILQEGLAYLGVPPSEERVADSR